MIDEILQYIGEDKHQNFGTTSNKFKRDLWNFFLKPDFSTMVAVEFGTHKGQTTRVLSHLFRRVYTINIDELHLESAMQFNHDLDNIVYVPFDLYKNHYTVNPVDDVINVFLIDAGHDLQHVELDMARAIHMNLADDVYFVFDDYGMMSGVKTVVDSYIECGILELVETIGHISGYNFGGNPARVLSASEGVICKLVKSNIYE